MPQKIARHEATRRATAPNDGAITGTSTKMAMAKDMVRAIWLPSKRSRTMAMASERGPAAPNPPRTRHSTSTSSDGASAEPTAPTT